MEPSPEPIPESLAGSGIKSPESPQEHELTPMERYLVKPFIGSSHSWALGILEEVEPKHLVLDIGPGSGIMGKTLRERGVQQTYAVEIDEDARRYVAPYYAQVADSICAFEGNTFDWVLLLDVLEHMSDPFDFLRRLDPLLAPGAKILISLPNVAHWSVRIPLLFGYFEYTSRGILDRTHLQFFTRRRFQQLLASRSLWHLRQLSASIEPVEFVLPKWMWNNSLFRRLSHFRVKVAGTLPGLMAFQHLALLEKRAN